MTTNCNLLCVKSNQSINERHTQERFKNIAKLQCTIIPLKIISFIPIFYSYAMLIPVLQTHCPNLQLLDMSNVRTVAMNGLIHIEKLQEGCQKLRVFRITNSQFALAVVPLIEQVTNS